MAKEAILKIKEAEDIGLEKVKKAIEKSKEIIKAAGIEGSEKKREIITAAYKEKELLVEKAKQDALENSETFVDEGNEEINNIKNPTTDNLEKAIKLVMERIVNGNGYS